MNEEEKDLELTEESATEQTTETTEESKPTPEAEVPDELKGLSPDILKEAMQELSSQQDEQAEPQEEESAEEEADTAEPDSVKNTEESVIKKPSQKIPYSRFKEVLDKNNEMKAELEALRAQAKNNTVQQAPQQQVQNPAPRPATPKQSFRVTPEITQQIDSAVQQLAMNMCGLTQEDLNSMEYMDEDDQRKVQYNHAKKLAEARVYSSIEQARQQQIMRNQQILNYHQQVVNSFNEFCKAEQSAEDYEQVRDYAKGEFYDNIPQEDKQIIMDAYNRVERNTASPQDVAVVKRFFTDAKNSFHNKQAAPAAKQTTKNVETKYKQSKAFPRAAQVAGSAANTGTPSADALERMLTEVPWDEIPQEYKDLVMNSSTLG